MDFALSKVTFVEARVVGSDCVIVTNCVCVTAVKITHCQHRGVAAVARCESPL